MGCVFLLQFNNIGLDRNIVFFVMLNCKSMHRALLSYLNQLLMCEKYNRMFSNDRDEGLLSAGQHSTMAS